jgi:hypothetical protein
MSHAVRKRKDESLLVTDHPEEEQSPQASSQYPDPPPIMLVELKVTGGEAPCWTHLLDGEGHLDEDAR